MININKLYYIYMIYSEYFLKLDCYNKYCNELLQ